ncbi:LysR family transcriptional regulator [Mangrovicoccus sp. HB161399]|uniref:LysR family transcriptional regulator n=1 Tax=Mangrovicoccus sp. HB161399 TaxID=2720392 RepID=UPI001553B956|nr:LysR family transcriptional regulator [Mangrovicoccus sp. HB161399]
MQITLKHLEAFIWVATLQSFRRAAEQLNTTQPNISNRLNSLEAMVGTRLFERDAGSVRITQSGQALLPLAERVVASVDQFRAAAAGEQSVTRLRLGVTEVVALTWLRDYLRIMRERMPKVLIEVRIDFTSALRPLLMERAIDLAFLNGPLSPYDVRNHELGSVPFVWVGRPGASPSRERHLDFAQLGAWPLLAVGASTRSFTELQRVIEMTGAPETQIIASSSLATCHQMALDGLGAALVPDVIVRPDIAMGALELLDCDWLPSPMNFTASYLARPVSHVVTAAAETAREVARWQVRAG